MSACARSAYGIFRDALLHGMKVEELDVEGLVDDATEG